MEFEIPQNNWQKACPICWMIMPCIREEIPDELLGYEYTHLESIGYECYYCGNIFWEGGEEG